MTIAVASRFDLAPHQQQAVVDAREHDWRWGCFWQPRTGKTRTALAITVEAQCERILLVCPGIAAGVWREEARLIGYPLPILIALESDLDKRAATIRSWIALHPHSMIITNYQSFWKPKIAPLLLEWKPDAVLSDECQALRGRTTRQSKFAGRIGNIPSVRCCLPLGRAIVNGIQDLFGIYRFFNPTVFPLSWSKFAERYLTFGYFNEITGSKNDEEVQRILFSTSSQIRREDVWGGMPKRRDQEWPVVLTDESAARYRQLAKDFVADIEGFGVDGNSVQGTLSAELVITRAMRLQQLLGGHTKIDGTIVDVSSEKVDAAVGLTRQTLENDEQVVLFCAFRREIARIREALSELYPGRVAVIQGGMEPEDQTALIKRFTEGLLSVLIIQIHAGSKSIELDKASVGIIVSTGYDVDDFDQANQRLTGTDPNREFDFYYLKGVLPSGKSVETVDHRIYQALENKQNISGRFSRRAARELLSVE